MYIIKSLKNLFFSHTDNEIQLTNLKENQELYNILFKNFYICFHKYIFKSNYKRKKEKEKEINKTESIINKNEHQNNNNIKISELDEEKEEVNKRFFYILKGAIYVIEDWWKKKLKQKEYNNKILQRNFNNKNFIIFSNDNINNLKSIKNYIKDKYQNNNNTYRNENVNLKVVKTANNPININIFNQEQNTLDETLINSDSCFFDFTIKNKPTKESIKTKRDNNIIYPIKEINLVFKQDLNKNKKNINKLQTRKEIEQDSVTIPWEQYSKRFSKNSLEKKNKLFKEVKSKIKLNNDVLSLMNNKYLLKENPFDESSIYINNSDISQNDLIRNVNVHIMPFEIKNISLKKYANNSNNSFTIQNEDDEFYSSILSSIYKNDEKEKYNIIKDNKNYIKKEIEHMSDMKLNNIYKS